MLCNVNEFHPGKCDESCGSLHTATLSLVTHTPLSFSTRCRTHQSLFKHNTAINHRETIMGGWRLQLFCCDLDLDVIQELSKDCGLIALEARHGKPTVPKDDAGRSALRQAEHKMMVSPLPEVPLLSCFPADQCHGLADSPHEGSLAPHLHAKHRSEHQSPYGLRLRTWPPLLRASPIRQSMDKYFLHKGRCSALAVPPGSGETGQFVAPRWLPSTTVLRWWLRLMWDIFEIRRHRSAGLQQV